MPTTDDDGPITPDAPAPPGTPPLDLDVDPPADPEEQEETPTEEDVRPGAAATEPPD